MEGGMDLRYRRKSFRATLVAHCGEYRAILEHFHFSPETLRCETDLARLPALPTAFLKGVRFIPCRVGASWSGQRHPAQKDR